MSFIYNPYFYCCFLTEASNVCHHVLRCPSEQKQRLKLNLQVKLSDSSY